MREGRSRLIETEHEVSVGDHSRCAVHKIIPFIVASPKSPRNSAAGQEIIIRRARLVATGSRGLAPHRAVKAEIIEAHDKKRRNVIGDGKAGRTGDVEI